MEENNELGFCPSFSCYSSNTAETAARVSIQFQKEKEQDFEFPPNDDVVSDHQTVFPVFNRDLLTHVVVCDGPSIDTCDDSLQSLFITERERERERERDREPEHEEYVSSSSSSSSSESEEEEEGSGMFCVWRNYKTGAGSSSPSPLSKCKKSSSTGSGSKRWRIRDFLMRSNSEGKEPMILITDNNTNNKVDQIMKEKRNSGEVAGKTKAQSVHELFYVQQRAKREDGKRKSYLPYRQGLVGFFSNVNGKANKFPF